VNTLVCANSFSRFSKQNIIASKAIIGLESVSQWRGGGGGGGGGGGVVWCVVLCCVVLYRQGPT